MPMPDHIINREIFEFTYSETEHAFALQNQMNNGLQYKMQTVIDNVLDEYNDENTITRLDKLEIDLGEIPFGSLYTILPEKLYIAFRKEMLNAIKDRNTYLKEISHCEASENINDDLTVLEIFLLTGSLPWWAGSAKDFSPISVINYFIENSPERLKSLLFKNINNEQFIERLIYQLEIEVIERLIMLLPVSKSHISFIENIINNYTLKVSQSFSPELSIGEVIFPEKLSALAGIDGKKNVLRVLIKLIAKTKNSHSEEEMQVLLEKIIVEVFKGRIEAIRIEEELKMPGGSDFYSEMILLKEEMKPAYEVADNSTSSDSEIVEEKNKKIYIQNAGLVLIAAFLPSLYKELRLIENGMFMNKDLQFKGLFLLHYICTGQAEAPEYTLQLNKILCGLDLEEPIPYSVDLTDTDKKEADLLLKDILTHWGALRNSTVEALQGSFLLRDGLLSSVNDHWLLQVERKGYDVLIDHLPWSWKTTKFDWMDSYIDTEW